MTCLGIWRGRRVYAYGVDDVSRHMAWMTWPRVERGGGGLMRAAERGCPAPQLGFHVYDAGRCTGYPLGCALAQLAQGCALARGSIKLQWRRPLALSLAGS